MFCKSTALILTLCLTLLLSFNSVAQAAPPSQGPFSDSHPTSDIDDDDGEDVSASGSEARPHPVANFLAGYFNVSYDEIKALHDSGFGFGTIVKAYILADRLNTTPHVLLIQAPQIGWGNLLKQNDIHPGILGKPRGNQIGNVDRSDHIGVPGHVNKDGPFVPPGQVKKANFSAPTDQPDADGQFLPPGQAKKGNLSAPPGQTKKHNTEN